MVETQTKANPKEMAEKQTASYKIIIKGISETLGVLCSVCAENSTCPYKQELRKRLEQATSITNPFMQMIAADGAKRLVTEEIINVVGQGKFKELEPKIDEWFTKFSAELEPYSDIVKMTNPLQVFKDHPERITEVIQNLYEFHGRTSGNYLLHVP
jgi:hypothetical protein